MASLQERGGNFRLIFRYQGKQHFVRLGKVTRQEAEAKAGQADYLLMRLQQRLIELPPGMDIAEFVLSDGKAPADGRAVARPVAKTTLALLRDRYLETHAGAHEEASLRTARIHFKHLTGTLGERFPLSELKPADLQRHIQRRAALGISPVTIRKEIDGVRAAWNWGKAAGLIAGDWPAKGLAYPKGEEPPPFQTFEEIERQIAKGKLGEEERAALWDCLYLRVEEIAQLLACAQERALHPWIYPLACLAAHTGMRRSELVRAGVADVDFEGGSVIIRERKRVKGKRSTRRAPLTPLLRSALAEWLQIHPGGEALFCHAGEVARSSKRSPTTGHANGKARPTSAKARMESVRKRASAPEPGPLTVHECHDHFKRTLAGTKWEVVKGLHVLRHSLVSCLAAAGTDQRIIDDIVGHTSEEMRRRYRHLTPQVKAQAVAAVFG